MIRVFAILTTTVLGTASLADTQVCMNAAEMEASLIDWYGEAPVEGEARDNMQLWASDRTGTWTVVRYLVDGTSCVVDQGKGWTSPGEQGVPMAALDP